LADSDQRRARAHEQILQAGPNLDLLPEAVLPPTGVVFGPRQRRAHLQQLGTQQQQMRVQNEANQCTATPTRHANTKKKQH